MTKPELEALMKGIASPIVDTIKKALDTRVGPLEQRLANLEQAHGDLLNRLLDLEAHAAAMSKVDV